MPVSTPPSGSVHVVIVRPAAVQAGVEACLSDEEKSQAARFHFERDARHWSACRSALRTVLGECLGIAPAAVLFRTGKFGKPELFPPRQDLHFNLSHCRDLALIALCRDGAVGIDVEPSDRVADLQGCEHAFCHPRELDLLPGAGVSELLRTWTAKEALLKALGTGMSVPPASISVAGPDGPRSPYPDFRLHRLRHPDLAEHTAHLAAPAPVDRVTIQGWPAVTPAATH